jgi:RNA recognition motif-containing protein
VTIYVGNLSFEASEEDIRDVFVEYGPVVRITMPIDRETGKQRGFAFVDMVNDEDEDKAIADLDGAEWLGRELKVNKAKPKESAPSSAAPRPRGNFSRNPL